MVSWLGVPRCRQPPLPPSAMRMPRLPPDHERLRCIRVILERGLSKSDSIMKGAKGRVH